MNRLRERFNNLVFLEFFVVVFFISIFVLGKTVYAYSKFYPNGESTCLTSSGGRGSFMSVQYACAMAVCRTSATPETCMANKGQNGCSGWLGPVGNSSTRTIKLSVPSANSTANVQLFGMCTDSNDTTSALAFANDNGSIAAKTFNRPNTWGNPGGPTTTIDVSKFIIGDGVTKTTNNGVTTYFRQVGIGRGHSDGESFGGDVAWIYITIGGEPPDPDPVSANCGEWGSVVPGTTSTLIRVKNDNLFARSNGAAGAWNEDKVYAKPEDDVTWHACYYPGVQFKTYEKVSEVTGNYHPKKLYKPETLPDDSCLDNDGTVDIKELWDAVGGAYWNNYFNLNITATNKDNVTMNLNSRASGSFGGSYEKGIFDGKEAENTLNIGRGDVRYKKNIITEKSTTSSPTYADVKDDVLAGKEVWGGSCYKKVTMDGATKDAARIDDENVYPLCTGTPVFTDANGSYFNLGDEENPKIYPWVLGKESLASSSYCWVPVTGATSCKDCHGVASCMKALGCKTCNGNSDCTENCCACNDNFDCYQCTNKYAGADGNNNRAIKTAKVNKGPANDDASVVVPYNYKLDTGIELDTEYRVYSGETVKIKEFWIDVLTRSNGKTYDDYATVVPDAKYALVSYVTKDPSGGFVGGGEVPGEFNDLCKEINNKIKDNDKKPKQCAKIKEYSGELNGEGNLWGKRDSPIKNSTQNAFDASAGDYLCMVSAVWPTESAGDTDTGSGGNNRSRYSTPSCVQIAKRPTFQVWGGDMYSRVNVENDFANKRNVYASYYHSWNNLGDFKATGDTPTHFGSWVQEGLVLGGTNGSTKTIASGAALGRNPSSEKTAYTGNDGKLCNKMVPLTFANNCDNDGPAVSANVGSLSGDPKSLINYWISNPDGGEISGTHDLDYLWNSSIGIKQESATNTEIKHLKINGSLNITGGEMGNSRTLLIDYKDTTDGKVTIGGNIKYGTGFNSLGQVPKLIIYAKNIDISCNVTEIDAILIADSRVNTCYDGGNESNSIRMTPLKIVGTVIVNGNPTRTSDGNVINGGITLGRTYGAAAWCGETDKNCDKPNGQGEAAEIFDYDSTILMWSEYMSSSAQTDTLQTVYQHELAPRY